MLAYCGRPPSAAFRDPFPYIVHAMRGETIAKIGSMRDALATAIIRQTDSKAAAF